VEQKDRNNPTPMKEVNRWELDKKKETHIGSGKKVRKKRRSSTNLKPETGGKKNFEVINNPSKGLELRKRNGQQVLEQWRVGVEQCLTNKRAQGSQTGGGPNTLGPKKKNQEKKKKRSTETQKSWEIEKEVTQPRPLTKTKRRPKKMPEKVKRPIPAGIGKKKRKRRQK